jgi:hypothetical protein
MYSGTSSAIEPLPARFYAAVIGLSIVKILNNQGSSFGEAFDDLKGRTADPANKGTLRGAEDDPHHDTNICVVWMPYWLAELEER